jgi:predicted RNA methylase
MSIDMLDQAYSIATHDEAAANIVDMIAASAGTGAQILTKLGNPRAGQVAAIARDLRLW